MLTIIKGEGKNSQKPRQLRALLAVAWEEENRAARRMVALAELHQEPRARARLMVLAAFCRAHASRLLVRLAALGRGPLPVPDEDALIGKDIIRELRYEAAQAKATAKRYEELAEISRKHSDLSSAWVCELNRTEEQDRARELLVLTSVGLPSVLPAGSTSASVLPPPAQGAPRMATRKTDVKKALAHKWVDPSDEDYAKIKDEGALRPPAFFKKCVHCGCMRRIASIQNTRMYVPKGGRWSSATARAPKCVEPKQLPGTGVAMGKHMEPDRNSNAPCGGAVIYNGTPTLSWRACMKCGANTSHGDAVSVEGELVQS